MWTDRLEDTGLSRCAFDGTLDTLCIDMMTANCTAARIDRESRGGKNVLPTECERSRRIFDRQGRR